MRHAKIVKRKIEADKVYNSPLAAKFINNLMRDGKKTIAQKIFYDTMKLLSEKNEDPLLLFEQVLQKVGPNQEIKARRVGGASYQIPMEVKGERKMTLAIRWIIEAARSRSNRDFHTFPEKLAAEIIDASNNIGEAVKKRDNVHRMAEANKAFSHFRF